MSATGSSEGKVVRLVALTSLRFFAASAIVIHHSKGTILPVDLLQGWNLGQGVSLFFVLSGFILVHVYPDLPTKEAIINFWIARIARIWPAHLVALALVLVVIGRSTLGGNSFAVFAANALMVHAWIPSREYFFSFNALSWTISTELGFYVLFPLLIYRFRSTWMWKLVAAAALLVGLIVICTVWQIPSYSATNNGVTSFSLLYISPLGRLFEFVLGMCTALWWHRIRPLIGSNLWLWTVAEVVSFAAALWFVRYGTWHIIQWVRSTPFPVAQEWLIHASSCFSFAVLIFVFASGTGLVGRLLSLSPFVFLGEISYATYMLHQILIGFYGNHRIAFPPIPDQLQFPIFAIVLLVASALIYLLVEQPVRIWIRLLSSRRNRKPYATSKV